MRERQIGEVVLMNEENISKVIKEFLDSGIKYWEQRSSEGYKIRISRLEE